MCWICGWMCCGSDEDRVARDVNRRIEKELQKHKETSRKELKMLLLGIGEAGKSTVLKQMQIIHGKEFAEESKRLEFVQSIRDNVIESILIILGAIDHFSIPFENDSSQEHAAIVLDYRKTYSQPDRVPLEQTELQNLFGSISILWDDPSVQRAYQMRNDYVYVYLSDSAKYFLDRCKVIAEAEYVPTEQDILRVRKSSTGVKEYVFKISQVFFRVVDVGGQRTERRKWIHCFEKVTSVIFVSSLAEYDQLLLEVDNKTGEQQNVNRLTESLALFNVILHERFLQEAAIILFLNKTDIFEEKIAARKLEKYFPEYAKYSQGDGTKNGRNGESATGKDFILQMFLTYVQTYLVASAEQTRNSGKFNTHGSEPDKLLYSHFTCATDTKGMRFVTKAVEDYNLRISLMDFHLQ